MAAQLLTGRWGSVDPRAGIAGAEVLSQTTGLAGHTRAEQLAIEAHYLNTLIPSNTRTVQAAMGLTVEHKNASWADAAVGRMFTDGRRRFKRYVLGQEHFQTLQAGDLVREPGSEPGLFEPGISSYEAQTQGFGLKVRANGEDIREADQGLGNVLDIKRRLARQRLGLRADTSLFIYVTTAGNYATGHSGAVGTAWDAGGSTPWRDVMDGKMVIRSDCGQLGNIPDEDLNGAANADGEWVLLCGPQGLRTLGANADIQTRWDAHASPTKTLNPDTQAIAQALGVSRIAVCWTTTGPAQLTTSLPVVTSNAFLWPAATTSAALLWISKSVRFDGTAAPGDLSALALVSQYGPWENNYFEGDAYTGPEGQVEASNIIDDFVVEPIAVDDAATPTMIGAYLLTGIHA